MKAFALLALVPLATAVPYGQPAYGYGGYGSHGGYGGHGYGHPAPKPQANCSVEDVHESAQVCVPTLETTCNPIKLVRKSIVDKELCYDVTRTVCTESTEEIDNEICNYSYKPKTETTSAQNVEVSFQKECDTQMVTMCDTVKVGYGHGYGHGYGKGYGYGHGYGHGYGKGHGKGYKHVCKQVEQETCRNVPVVTPVQPAVDVTYPEPMETCINKPISLPRISCENLTENKCITVPQVEKVTDSVDVCETKLSRPDCQEVELDLPQQVCVEMVYGFSHDKYEEPKYEEPKYEEPEYEEPKYEEPKYEEPKYEEPKYEKPKYEEPKYEEPKYEEPKYEEPKYEEPKYEEPKYEEPKYEEPKYEEPKYEEPKYEEPKYEEPLYEDKTTASSY
jgi:hypothetical protein